MIVKKIDCFKDEYFFLSNFYEVPVEYDGLKYGSSEAAYQAQKCEFPSKRKEFQNLSPSKSKSLGKKVTLREDWDEVKYKVMLEIVRNKFKQNSELKEKLIATGDTYLEEGNWWGDIIWGVCNGIGKNILGKILMKVRDELKNKQL